MTFVVHNFIARSDGEVYENCEGTLCDAYSNQNASS